MAGPIYTGSDSGPGSGGESPPVTTWANRPAVGPVGSSIYVSDVGEYGATFISNGTSWRPDSDIEIIQKGKGWIVPSMAPADSSTYSQTGTLITITSAGHNIPAIKYDSKNVYIDFGAPTTGSQLTSGWYSNFNRITINTFSCVSAISQSGTGVVKTNNAATVIPDTVSTIPGGILGLNGCIFYSALSSHNNSAGVKNVIFNFNGETITYGNAFDEVRIIQEDIISNRNNLASQALAENGIPIVTSVNTANDVTCSFSLQCATTSDFVAIHSAAIYISIS
ncbi:MAG: hypothetical protein PHR19_02305 [Bacteroidales bacterium]|nr:hypothetical protein [Bacteroidales bacterium]